MQRHFRTNKPLKLKPNNALFLTHIQGLRTNSNNVQEESKLNRTDTTTLSSSFFHFIKVFIKKPESTNQEDHKSFLGKATEKTRGKKEKRKHYNASIMLAYLEYEHKRPNHL